MMRTIDGYDNKITTVMNMMVTIKIAMLMAMMIDDGFDEDKHEESDLPNDHYYDPHLCVGKLYQCLQSREDGVSTRVWLEHGSLSSSSSSPLSSPPPSSSPSSSPLSSQYKVDNYFT